jgi:hypothetical protein
MFLRRQRRNLIIVAIALVTMLVWPFHDRLECIGLPLALVSMWWLILRRVWRNRVWRSVLGMVPVVAVWPFCLPGKPFDVAELRGRYLAAMRGMEGALYVWGGESHFGIDCSGLPRRGLRDALLEEGWQRGNGAAFREWASQWWFDESAMAMGQGYRGRTFPLGIEGELRTMDFSRLQPGDLAVTVDGHHVMIFLGGDEWIQADPTPMKVTISKISSDHTPWFDATVSIHRWSVFR